MPSSPARSRARRRRALAFAAFAAALSVAARPASGAAPIIERVMAIVSGSMITLTDVHAAVALGLVDAGGAADPLAGALERLIERTLMLAEVERYAPPEPAPAAIDARVEALRARLGPDGSGAPALAAYGLTPDRLRAIARDDLRLASYLDQRFAPSVPVSREEVERYYRDHREEFSRQGEEVPLAGVEAEIRRRLEGSRRAALVEEWTRGLRLRAEVAVLYLPGR